MAEDKLRKAENRIEWLVGKLIPKRIFNVPLAQQVKMAERLMAMTKGGMATVRSNLLKEQGIPEDVQDMQKAGKSRAEIKDYYWGCKEFREFWVGMEMDEGFLDTLIDDALSNSVVT